MTSTGVTFGWFCWLLFARAHVPHFETERSVCFTTIPVVFSSASFLTRRALIWPMRRCHNITLDVSLTLAYSLGSSGRITSRKYRLRSVFNGKCSPVSLSPGEADIIVSTPFAITGDEYSRLRLRPGTNVKDMVTSRCMPAVFATPIVRFTVSVASNSCDPTPQKQHSVVEAPGTREGVGLRSESSRGPPYEMISRCQPVVDARLSLWTKTMSLPR